MNLINTINQCLNLMLDNSKPSATNQTIFNAIAASTSQPVKRLANGVSYLDIKACFSTRF
jgi:hypothetical protein